MNSDLTVGRLFATERHSALSTDGHLRGDDGWTYHSDELDLTVGPSLCRGERHGALRTNVRVRGDVEDLERGELACFDGGRKLLGAIFAEFGVVVQVEFGQLWERAVWQGIAERGGRFSCHVSPVEPKHALEFGAHSERTREVLEVLGIPRLLVEVEFSDDVGEYAHHHLGVEMDRQLLIRIDRRNLCADQLGKVVRVEGCMASLAHHPVDSDFAPRRLRLDARRHEVPKRYILDQLRLQRLRLLRLEARRRRRFLHIGACRGPPLCRLDLGGRVVLHGLLSRRRILAVRVEEHLLGSRATLRLECGAVEDARPMLDEVRHPSLVGTPATIGILALDLPAGGHLRDAKHRRPSVRIPDVHLPQRTPERLELRWCAVALEAAPVVDEDAKILFLERTYLLPLVHVPREHRCEHAQEAAVGVVRCWAVPAV
mmetsp:Transcript_31907/g.84323  ORF Transcript_31907/g.84323 Transcript_31907/m.84323 type:complete len:429 (-) Transcript_31907:248-1534(-)